MNVDRAAAQKNESENVYAGLIAENHEIEKQLQEINDNKAKISEEIEYVKTVRARLRKKIRTSSKFWMRKVQTWNLPQMRYHR